jgi:hypothetical protein
MAISKIGSKALVDCSVAAVDIADNSITAAKLAGSIANAKLANSSVTINSTSVSLGASANINPLDWQSVIVADGSTGTTGVAGRGYFINTTSAAHTFTLPVSATRGDTIAIKDYAGTFATFNLTIGRNGHNIQGVANNSLISTNRASVVLVYADVTRGWEFTTESNVAELVVKFITATGGTILTDGNFKTHVFTGDGCFAVSQLGNPLGGPSNVDYLVVAGGGSGGGGFPSGGNPGGGGAGGYRTTFPSPGCNAGSFPISATTYPITVGGGGAAAPAAVSSPAGNSGNPSIFSTITSTGGGGGGAPSGSPVGGNGKTGGSGGGAGYNAATGGAGNTPPTSPSQGNNGGASIPGGFYPYGAGGGGGAGAVGSGHVPAGSGPGGVGSPIATTFFGPTAPSYGTPGPAPGRYFAGGGGGGSISPLSTAGGTGGAGGGGTGGTGTAATINTGGGGGGSSLADTGAAGGSGIVVIRYKFQ